MSVLLGLRDVRSDLRVPIVLLAVRYLPQAMPRRERVKPIAPLRPFQSS